LLTWAAGAAAGSIPGAIEWRQPERLDLDFGRATLAL